MQSRFAIVSGNTAAWGVVTDLSVAGQHADDPQISISADGTKVTAVWLRYEGSKGRIQSKSATLSGNTALWGVTSDLSTAGQYADYPQNSLSSDGTKATAVWRLYNGSHYIVQSRSAEVMGISVSWGAVKDLSAIGETAKVPQLALSSDGTSAVAIWYRSNGSNQVIQSACAEIVGNAASWGSVSDLSAAGKNAYTPQISISSDGTKTTAVWHARWPSGDIVRSASAVITKDAATWSSATDLSSATGGGADAEQIALSSDGSKAVAVWQRQEGSIYIVQSASAMISGNTSIWDSVIDLSAAEGNSNIPQISLSLDGKKATAAWVHGSPGSHKLIQSKSAAIEDSGCYVIRSSKGKTVVVCF